MWGLKRIGFLGIRFEAYRVHEHRVRIKVIEFLDVGV